MPRSIREKFSRFSIGSGASLTEIAGSPFPAAPNPVAVRASGSFLYVANDVSGVVSAYSFDSASGTLTPVPGPSFTAGTTPSGVAVTPDGKFLYATNSGSNNVSAFSINSDGSLTSISSSPFSAGVGPVSSADEQPFVTTG